MRGYLKNLITKANISVEKQAVIFEPRILAFSAVAVIGFPLYYYIWHNLFPQPYENMQLRLAGSTIFLPLIFIKYWSRTARKYLPIYWYCSMIYGLPFFFTFMLLKNNGSTIWLLSTLIAVFIMILLLDGPTIIIQFTIGTTIAWISYYSTTDKLHINFNFESLPIYLFAIVLGSVANYTAEMLKQERLRATLAAASNIAHELRTPLLGIKTGAAGLRQYLPALLESYEIAKEHGLTVQPIRLTHLHAMRRVLDRIENEADQSNTIIDMLLMYTRLNGFKKEIFTKCSIVKCIETALERYPFQQEEQQLITFNNKNDFNFTGIELLMVHVIFNLIKNSLYHIAKANKGKIFIFIGRTQHSNTMIFKDTGSGVPPEVLPRIFARFYSWSPDNKNSLGAGIGLAFCTDVMNAFGGSIACKSQLGEYTEFTFEFPRKEQHEIQ